jgi:hypothetical protein
MAEITVISEWMETLSDKMIFGNFIESGFGRQVNGMWSEMIFNRAFRKVAPYTIWTQEWTGVDAEHYSDKMPSWHSGYEEFDWKTIGSDVKREYTLGTHTHKGRTSHIVTNVHPVERCGLYQDGLHLHKGKTYNITLLAGATAVDGLWNHFTEKPHPLELKLKSDSGTEYKTEFSLEVVPKNFIWSFVAAETEISRLSLSFDWEGTALLCCISMMPSDNVDGWRADVVEKLREIKVPVIRFPGGCFVSFYDWESTIGPRDEREPTESFFWGGLEENDVGVDEFMRLSELAGFEAQFCFNMMSSAPFKARQLVEYLNAPADIGMGRLRMLNGREKPYGVRLFEMDNEPGRKWISSRYAQKCVEFADEMRLADSGIELMMACYSYPLKDLELMLEIAGKHINYVIYRNGAPEFVEQALLVIREYNRKSGTQIKLANTEWLASCMSIEPYERPGTITNYIRKENLITNDYNRILGTYQISWNYALNAAHRLLDYLSYGGEFALANFNNCCNTWGQNIIEATKDSCFISCAGEVFAFFGRHFSPCVAAKTETGDDRVRAQIVKTEKGEKQLYLVNHSGNAIHIDLPKGKWAFAEGICAEERIAANREGHRAVKACHVRTEGGHIELPALSLILLRA